MPTSEKDPSQHDYYIAALARGLTVLSTFNEQKPELSLRDIAMAADVTQPSALRIAHTLVACEFMVRNPATKGYRLGPNAVSVGLATLGAMTLPEIAEPYLIELRDQTDETVKLGVPSRRAVVVVARQASRRHPPASQYIGSRAPMHIGSLGRAMLAWLPPDRVKEVLSSDTFQPRTTKSLSRSEVEDELERSRRRGYALNDQGVTAENRSVGAPLIAPSGHAIGSINLSISAQRCTMERLKADFAPLVVQAARRISATLPPQVQGAGDNGRWDLISE